MTSDVFGIFLTFLPTLIKYFTTYAHLVKSDAKSDAAWPTYLKIWRHMWMLFFRKSYLFYLVLKVSFYKITLKLINFLPACNFAIVSLNDDKVFLILHFFPLFLRLILVWYLVKKIKSSLSIVIHIRLHKDFSLIVS